MDWTSLINRQKDKLIYLLQLIYKLGKKLNIRFLTYIPVFDFFARAE